MEYPLDALSPNADLWDTMQSACQPREDVKLWRERMIGDQFDPGNFIKIVRDYIDKKDGLVV
jgi:hypothetical protein